MKSQLLEHKLNQTVLISGTLKQGSQLFSHFHIKKFFTSRNFSYICDTNKKHIVMKKIEKYVVFQYEDEFGFHYMVMDKLPGEGPTYIEPISFGKKINPNCTPGAITHQPFSEDGKLAYVLSSKFVPVAGWWSDKEDVLEWQERTRVYRAIKELKRKGKDLKLEKVIEPIQEAYNRLSPSRRSMFIAQVVHLITR
jgi:hypothetical protein